MIVRWDSDTGKLIYDGDQPPKGWIRVAKNTFEPNCADCIFRRFSTKSIDPPHVVIHCLHHRKHVTVEDCRQCPDHTVDTKALRDLKPWIVIHCEPSPEQVALQERLEEEYNSSSKWWPCKMRARLRGKKDCGTCGGKYGCTSPKSKFHGQEVYKINCYKCEVREE